MDNSHNTHVRLTVTHYQQQKKSLVEAYILALVLGTLGAHHFYLGRPWYGLAYFFTFGLAGFGYLIDLFRLPCLVSDINKSIREPVYREKKSNLDAYILWFPFGLLGFHLFYLRKPAQGLLYFFTFGVFGIGFLIDLIRIPYMVEEANEYPLGYKAPKSKLDGYLFALSPLGLLGAHHYYLERYLWGVLYTFTLGLFGVGWIYDWFRMPCLVNRANAIDNKEKDPGLKYVDDVYILWFPLGIMGWHHFYLNRPVWGLLYFFTFGLFGVGWLIDGFRLACMVNDYNRGYVQSQLVAQTTRAAYGGIVGTSPTGHQVVAVQGPTGVMATPAGMPPPYGYTAGPYPQQQIYPVQGGYQAGIIFSQGYPPGGMYQHLPQQPQQQSQSPPQPHPGVHGTLTTTMDPQQPPSYEQSVTTEKSGPPPS